MLKEIRVLPTTHRGKCCAELALGIMLAVVLIGCSFETPEQAVGRCTKEGVSSLPALSGNQAATAAAYLLGEYISGCMSAKGYRRNDNGEWVR